MSTSSDFDAIWLCEDKKIAHKIFEDALITAYED
jgi:hypothetical protein